MSEDSKKQKDGRGNFIKNLKERVEFLEEVIEEIKNRCSHRRQMRLVRHDINKILEERGL